MRNLISLIHYFELVSEMRSNWSKSCIAAIDSPSQDLLGIVKALNCAIRFFTIKYLGVPLSGSPRKRDFWIPILERC